MLTSWFQKGGKCQKNKKKGILLFGQQGPPKWMLAKMTKKEASFHSFTNWLEKLWACLQFSGQNAVSLPAHGWTATARLRSHPPLHTWNLLVSGPTGDSLLSVKNHLQPPEPRGWRRQGRSATRGHCGRYYQVDPCEILRGKKRVVVLGGCGRSAEWKQCRCGPVRPEEM